MYYNDYENYMRNVLGYSNMNNNTYQQYDSNYSNYNNYNNMQMNQYQTRNNTLDIEKMYPEIYRIINPIVCRMCDNNNQPISESLIEQMTNEIYDNVINRIEIQNVINLNVNTRECVDTNANTNVNLNNSIEAETSECNDCNRSSNNNRSSDNNSQNNMSRQNSNPMCSGTACNSQKTVENTTENRAPMQRSISRRNNLLRDLIRILILNQLFRQNRPPFRPQPPRPRTQMFDYTNINFGQPIQGMAMPPFDFS